MPNNPYQNRKVKESDFEPLPDQDYEVDGIDHFFSLDEREYPVFVPQGDQMICRYNLRLADRSKVGPAMSANHNQLVMLVRALGGDVSKLPEGDTTAFLIACQDEANNGAKKQIAKVKGGKGWAKYVTGTNPEADKFYTIQFAKATSVDGSEPVTFQDVTSSSKKGGSYTQSVAYFWFRIAGDMYGKPTVFDGYQFRVYVQNPFEGEVYQSTVNRWDKFVQLFAPDMDSWNWTEDPEQSPYGVNELENPLVVFVGEALKANRLAVAMFKLNEAGFPKMDMADWAQSDATSVIDVDKKQAEAAKQPWQLAELVELLDEVVMEAVGVKAFEPTPKNSDVINLTWTDQGLKWAKENLAKLWDEAKLPLVNGKRPIGNLTGGEAALLDNVVRKAFGKEKAAKNEALTDGGSF